MGWRHRLNFAEWADARFSAPAQRGYGAAAARATPDHKVGSSNLSGLTHSWRLCGGDIAKVRQVRIELTTLGL